MYQVFTQYHELSMPTWLSLFLWIVSPPPISFIFFSSIFFIKKTIFYPSNLKHEGFDIWSFMTFYIFFCPPKKRVIWKGQHKGFHSPFSVLGLFIRNSLHLSDNQFEFYYVHHFMGLSHVFAGSGISGWSTLLAFLRVKFPTLSILLSNPKWTMLLPF